jgi:hypothetical protein
MSKLNLIAVIAIASVMLASVAATFSIASYISNAFAQGNASSSTSLPSDNMTGYYKNHKPDHPLRMSIDNMTGGDMTGMSIGNNSMPMTNNSK